MTDPAEEWLTIAAAAQRLALAERQARRYAQRLPDSDRTLDRTVSGRSRTLVRLSALSEIAEQVRRSGQVPDSDRTSVRTEDRAAPAASVSLAQAYEIIIKEQQGRIADLQAALDHSREQERRLTDALTREQSLRLLTAPAAAEETATAAADAEERPAEPAPDHPVYKDSFWRRLWKRRGE